MMADYGTLNKGFYTLEMATEFDRSVNLIMYYPNIFVRDTLKNMPKEDLTRLENDFSKWIHREPIFRGVLSRFKYALPGYYFMDNAVPDDVTELHKFFNNMNIEGDQFFDHGKKVSKALMDMVAGEIQSENEEYFSKYHKLVCFQICRDMKQCIRRRKKIYHDYMSVYI